MLLGGINLWFADIVNYLVASILPPKASRSYKDKIKSDAKYYMWDDPYLWKICSVKFCPSTSVGGHYGSHWIASAKELEWTLPVGMRCPNSLFFLVRPLMFGVLISCVHFLFLMVTLIRN
ncbi:hypothetical protein CR513_21693, partial [Mucuna pruriens]